MSLAVFPDSNLQKPPHNLGLDQTKRIGGQSSYSRVPRDSFPLTGCQVGSLLANLRKVKEAACVDYSSFTGL